MLTGRRLAAAAFIAVGLLTAVAGPSSANDTGWGLASTDSAGQASAATADASPQADTGWGILAPASDDTGWGLQAQG